MLQGGAPGPGVRPVRGSVLLLLRRAAPGVARRIRLPLPSRGSAGEIQNSARVGRDNGSPAESGSRRPIPGRRTALTPPTPVLCPLSLFVSSVDFSGLCRAQRHGHQLYRGNATTDARGVRANARRGEGGGRAWTKTGQGKDRGKAEAGRQRRKQGQGPLRGPGAGGCRCSPPLG